MSHLSHFSLNRTLLLSSFTSTTSSLLHYIRWILPPQHPRRPITARNTSQQQKQQSSTTRKPPPCTRRKTSQQPKRPAGTSQQQKQPAGTSQQQKQQAGTTPTMPSSQQQKQQAGTTRNTTQQKKKQAGRSTYGLTWYWTQQRSIVFCTQARASFFSGNMSGHWPHCMQTQAHKADFHSVSSQSRIFNRNSNDSFVISRKNHIPMFDQRLTYQPF